MTIEGKRIVLITGGMSLFSHGFSMSETDTPCTANAGIGFELAAQLLADPSKHILLGSRSIEKGEAAFKKLQERGLKGTVELVHINVIDGASIVAAVKSVGNKHGRIDVLVNNAGIADTRIDGQSSFAKLNAVFATNAAGPFATTEAFAPLLAKSNGTPRIVNVSTGGSSITMKMDPKNEFRSIQAEAYRISKAAMNMATACQIYKYESKGFKFFLWCPGYTESNFSPRNKMSLGAKPTSEGAAPMVAMINGERDADAGKLLSTDHDGGECPW